MMCDLSQFEKVDLKNEDEKYLLNDCNNTPRPDLSIFPILFFALLGLI
jgi:hypothetical protein